MRDERPAEGHLRDRRAVDVRQHPPRLLARHARGRRLHQDLHRQGRGQRDARQHPADAGGGARLPCPDRRPGRREAGRRHPHQQGRRQVPRPGQRDRRRGLAGQPLVPLRRLLAAERPADAASEAGHRPLLRPRLRDGGLRPHGHGNAVIRIRVRTGARVPLGRRHRAVLRPLHRRRVRRGDRRQGLQDRLAVHRGGPVGGRRGRR
ncbi:hypothetical protein SGPA1_12278 [Streptomyces misionensis JCM 4497]